MLPESEVVQTSNGVYVVSEYYISSVFGTLNCLYINGMCMCVGLCVSPFLILDYFIYFTVESFELTKGKTNGTVKGLFLDPIFLIFNFYKYFEWSLTFANSIIM